MSNKFGWEKARARDVARKALRERRAERPLPNRKPKPVQHSIKFPAILPAGSSVTISKLGRKSNPRIKHVTRRDIIIEDVLPCKSPASVAARYCGYLVFMRSGQLQPMKPTF